MKPAFRIGIGFDFHPFEEGRDLLLGGVLIPSAPGLKGHSDADVLLHAISDSLLGAAGLKDIGSHFPDTDPRFEGMSSLVILARVHQLVQEEGFRVGNLDAVIIAEAPRLKPHIDSIRESISQILELEQNRIGIKATTMEGKGPIGRREGIAAQAISLIFSDDTF